MKIFDSITEVIIIYAPVLLSYVTQIIEWIVTYKKFTKLNIKEQLKPVVEDLRGTAAEVMCLEMKLSSFIKEKGELSDTIKDLRSEVLNLKEQMAQQNEFLKALSSENIELKACLRRKEDVKTNS